VSPAEFAVAGLLERGAELAAIDALLEGCASGQGGVLLLRGPAGIGKTALLGASRESARSAGIRVLEARCGEFEREFAHAVTRQLFEPALAAAPPAERAELLAGAARLAGPIVDLEPAHEAVLAIDQAFAVVHGLYWLTANLARAGPVLVMIDDAHWCDKASLGFLLYVARRLEGLSVAVLVAARAFEPGGEPDPLDLLAAEPVTRLLTPPALSAGAVGELVTDGLGDPDQGFVSACHDATGGNPYLVRELIAALARDRVAPVGTAIERIGALGPRTVARSVVLRLAQELPAAGTLARAVAVLGDPGELRQAAALAGLDREHSAQAFDALVRLEILEPQLPPSFVHPIVRAAIYDDIGAAARALAHARAARLLANDATELGRVALHLLRSDPSGDTWVVDALCAAATDRLATGDADAAADLLERALAEPPTAALRPGVLAELGRCEDMAGRSTQADQHLREALARTTSDDERAEFAVRLGLILLRRGQVSEATDLIRRELKRAGEGGAHSVALQTYMCLGLQFQGSDGWREVDERLERLAPGLDAGTPDGRMALALLAYRRALAGEPASATAAAALAALDGGLLDDPGAESGPAANALGALLHCEQFAAAAVWIELALERSRTVGSIFGFAIASYLQALLRWRVGDLSGAIAAALSSIEANDEYGAPWGSSLAIAVLIDASAERGEFETIERELTARGLTGQLPPEPMSGLLWESRGRYRVVAGQPDAGLRDLREADERLSVWGARSPGFTEWRSTAALALHQLGRREEAAELAAEGLRLARALGTPRASAVALRTLGVIDGGERGLELLEAAVRATEGSPALLERGHGLLALGAAQRRAGRRTIARGTLQTGVDIARRCGAGRLVEWGGQELRAAGAKPRRRAFSGVDALTASERRIAEMIAGGMANREVAQALFVTAKTVENHLGRVYQKLGLHSRAEIADALGRDDAPAARPASPDA
jgi:DNA-binding CsgD family transcriptional regulator